jgi:hypothetical protein
MDMDKVSMTLSLLSAAVAVSSAVAVLLNRRRWFSAGWIRGRQAMTAALLEAIRRDLGLVEFLQAEAERDGYTLRLVARDE